MVEKTLNRRKLFATGSILLGSLGFTALASGGQCISTVAQPEGPFYPIADQFDKDNDLTHLMGHKEKALGDVVFLKGVVNNEGCLPVAGALVEIWQACDSGKYNHPGDPNTAELDPHFQYWGRTVTNEKGEYIFKTIKPGSYQANATWERPPHIHMKVHLRGFQELTTQVYFAEEKELNHKDLILQNLRSHEQNDVIVKFDSNLNGDIIGHFDIALKAI